MKNMKRNKFLPLALACALCLCLAACGDSFESAMVRAARELESVESVHADMSLDMGFGVDILGERSTLEMGMDVSMDTSGGLTSGELTLDMLGVTQPMQYIVQLDGDDCDVYLSTDGGASWETSLGLSGEGPGAADNAGSYNAWDMASFYLEFGGSFGDAVEETVNGAECRRYDGVLPGGKLGEAFALSGGSSLAELPEDMSPADAPLSIWLEKSSGLPRRITVDMTEAMSAYLAASLQAEGVDGAAVEVSRVFVSIDFGGYNQTVPATPPAA